MTLRTARTGARRARSLILATVVAIAAILVGVLGHPLWTASSSLASLPTPAEPRERLEGAVPDGVTVFDDEFPAVTNIEPDLLSALRQAASDAADDEIEFYVNSGWRTPAYQDQLLQEAVSEYGSEEEAARWVATAETSPHVSGDAVDIGDDDATAWLSEYGAAYGLCQIYANEPWHYELRPEASENGCPPPYADPTEDPRMQQ
ncbi:M15 family metallopeptidase [Solicola gregarius]|uniref:M15 family metallopeptidase n=1 Tax=Solicola gregarius TaxID=2908642 RepID=A0AA46TLS8_9ACTN|nr:M15 family metallopeptidase [Solicola gregarius]UYM07473.1 M15 family metallopeptidase [Solicola gregarius]